jgi:hypothetical protein
MPLPRTSFDSTAHTRILLLEQLAEGAKRVVDRIPVDDGLVVTVDQLLELGASTQLVEVLVAADLGVVLETAVHCHVEGLEALVNLKETNETVAGLRESRFGLEPTV